MAIERQAHATWEGDLRSGTGRFDVGSGAITGQEVTFASRFEDSGGKTSPEELIGAAHAACYSMALSHEIAQAGGTPGSTSVTAKVTFAAGEDGVGISGVALSVSGSAEGLGADGFRQAAEAAKDGCPVSRALAVPITLTIE